MLSHTELDAMRLTQEWHMMDECVQLIYSAGTDDYNTPSPVYTDGDTLICGIKNAKSAEGMEVSQVPLFDIQMRLSVNVFVSHLDRFRITRRFGERVTPETYEVVGAPKRGPSGVIISLRKVTDGS